jgi:hypothetical protein
LTPLRIEPIGEFSDRAFQIAEKLPEGADAPEVHITKPPGGLWAGLLRIVSPPPTARVGRPEINSYPRRSHHKLQRRTAKARKRQRCFRSGALAFWRYRLLPF